MRNAIITSAFAAGILFSATSVMAQANNPPAQNSPNNNAVNTPGANNSAAPVAGANSFTEAQAKSRIEAQGYSGVSGLTKDGNGVWRGMATKDGKSSEVSLDFQGNIFAR